MDHALTASHPAPLVAGGVMGRLSSLPARSKVGLGVGLAALAAVVVALSLSSGKGDYKVLYANLSDKDGGAVVAQLSQMNIPYRHADGGGAILVPAASVHDVRLKLASAGLPKGGIVGFELMDSARFGQSQFQERLTFQRGLEGELTRSITALSAVQTARVHLALPNQNGFFREQQKPSASVLLTLHAGRTLDRAQIAGIVHLVSSSVPELAPKAVSVLDQSGALISGAPDANPVGLDAQQLQYIAQLEANYTKRVFDILEPVVGRDNLRVQVTAEVDFTQTEATTEQFAPNQGPNLTAALRSQQTSESGAAAGSQATGIPGAASNQPAAAVSAPITGAVQPLQTAQAGAGGSGRRDAVTNYEVDRTVRVTRAAPGSVKRLNGAVVVNYRSVPGAAAGTAPVPLTAEEIDKLTSAVQEAIGFSKDRGDSVKVINAPFRIEALPTPVELPIWKQPETLDLLRAAAAPLALGLVALLVFFGLVRPAMKAALPPRPRPGRQLDTVVDDALPAPTVLSGSPEAPALEAPRSIAQLDSARRLARENPAAIASVVQDWVGAKPA